MIVKLLGGLGARLGKRVELRAKSVGELLERLAEMGGSELAKQLHTATPEKQTPVQLNRDLRVLVNGRSIAFLEGVETALGDGDTVTLHLAGARGFPGG